MVFQRAWFVKIIIRSENTEQPRSASAWVFMGWGKGWDFGIWFLSDQVLKRGHPTSPQNLDQVKKRQVIEDIWKPTFKVRVSHLCMLKTLCWPRVSLPMNHKISWDPINPIKWNHGWFTILTMEAISYTGLTTKVPVKQQMSQMASWQKLVLILLASQYLTLPHSSPLLGMGT